MNRRLILLLALVLPLGSAVAVDAPPSAEEAQRAAEQAAAEAERLGRRARDARDSAARAQAEAEALVAKIEAAESGITAADAQVAEIRRARRALERRLAAREQPAAELTAALVSMSRRPPAATFLSPGSVREAAWMRAALDGIRPVIAARTATLRNELNELAALRRQAEEARSRRAGHSARLTRAKAALAQFEEREMARGEALADRAFAEGNRALALGEEARLLRGRDAQRRVEARAASSLAVLTGPSFRDAPRRVPVSGRRAYRLPVAGRLLSGMGELSPAGIHNRGLIFAVEADEAAVAPAAGSIVYAAAFRSFGEIVIIDHGGGWTTLITGLATLGVRPGDRVAAGRIVGRTGSRPVGVELRRNNIPYPIAPLVAIG